MMIKASYIGLLAAACVFLSAPQDLQAFELSDGSYETDQDGGTGTLNVFQGQAVLRIKGKECSGEIAGELRPLSDGQLTFSQNLDGNHCALVLRDSIQGLIKIMPQQNCSKFNGPTCSFFGVVKKHTFVQH
jgi:hypothetical protein